MHIIDDDEPATGDNDADQDPYYEREEGGKDIIQEYEGEKDRMTDKRASGALAGETQQINDEATTLTNARCTTLKRVIYFISEYCPPSNHCLDSNELMPLLDNAPIPLLDSDDDEDLIDTGD